MATARKSRLVRPVDVLGLVSVALAIVLSSGVTTVRAEDGAEATDDAAIMSVDPALIEAAKRARAAHVANRPPAAPAGPPSGFVQLNTRGFNYGPGPQELDRQALRFEGAPAAPTPAPR